MQCAARQATLQHAAGRRTAHSTLTVYNSPYKRRSSFLDGPHDCHSMRVGASSHATVPRTAAVKRVGSAAQANTWECRATRGRRLKPAETMRAALRVASWKLRPKGRRRVLARPAERAHLPVQQQCVVERLCDVAIAQPSPSSKLRPAN